MKNYRQLIITTLIVISCGLIGVCASDAAPVKKQTNSTITAKCKADLAKRLNLQARNIKVVGVKPVTWPDSSLGMPEIGKVYLQMLTPGSRVILQAKNTQYLYTTSENAFRYGGPTSIWSYSLLYTQPIANEANLNRDLYQCSLLGTNSVRLASGITDYYPQAKGAILATQRTSRSGHNLMLIKAGSKAEPRILYSSFAFGDAALNAAQSRWAAFVKPMVGADWTVVIAGIGEDKSKAQVLAMPDGVRPERIAWSGEDLMILVSKGEGKAAYEISPKAASPEWKPVSAHLFPGLPDYMLNKSETLEIDSVTVNGKPGVEVAKVWFTGDRNVVAKIKDLTLQGYDFIGGRYALVWGEKDSKPAFYTVDIATGEIVPGPTGLSGGIKPFICPPQRNPMQK